MDWHQLWEIASAPDNVPIVAIIPLLAFYIWLAWRQARANDRLIEQLAADGNTQGCSADGRLYCPARPLTRAEMAIFLVRALNVLHD